ncbi:MAG: hypothetical protein ABIP94_24525, partial [Planctomycetota bacterium]
MSSAAEGAENVRITFDICVHRGRLADSGGITVPIDLLAALREEAKNHTVERLSDNTNEDKLKQAHLLYLALRT